MKAAALSLTLILILAFCNNPALPGDCEDTDFPVYREYREDLYSLQKDVTLLYMELQQGKNTQAVYQHTLQAIETTALQIGKAQNASQDIHDALQVSLQNHLEIILLMGLSDSRKESLTDLGYTDEDIAEIIEWLATFNDFHNYAVRGFAPEERDRLYQAGFTDDQISELQDILVGHYSTLHTASQVVKEQQTELLDIQTTLSIAALKLLLEETPGKGKKKDDGPRLQNAEEKLVEAIQAMSESQPSLEHVKAFSKEVYKAAEQELRKGEAEYMADFFIGLQIHCGALTALNGDTALGISEIEVYTDALRECSLSDIRSYSALQVPEESASAYTASPLGDFVGDVEELDETNNLGVALVFVKKPDLSFMELLVMLPMFVYTELGEIGWTLTLPDILAILYAILDACVTVLSIAVGVVGAVFLLVVTAPSVGYEWPPAVPGWIDGKQVVIVVEGSYGQAHIPQRAQSTKECVASSHQAILDDKHMIQEIIERASKLFYNAKTGRYIYYYVDDAGKEWAVFIEKYYKGFYQLISAYRVDCPPPYKCREDGSNRLTIIAKWLCEKFRQISIY
ncbi:MAG: hypothetical protein HXS52_14150 [Theionarchaea archaeon]|nr:hypothetical protein [Theionarchaea archaeon]